MRQEFWDQRVERVKECFASGLNQTETAAFLGITTTSVRAYAKRASLEGPSCPAIVDKIRGCAERGLTRPEAANELNLSIATVGKYSREYGIPFRHAGSVLCDPRSEPMAAMYKAGKTLEEIGSLYSVTRERVRQILKKYHGMSAGDGGSHEKAKQRAILAKAKKDAECMEKFGCTVSGLKELRAIGRAMMAAGASRDRTPTQAFVRQKTNARGRGIGWELTLAQWWAIWQESGKWEARGRGQGYMMCRFGDAGPYAVGNVYIATGVHNGSVQPNNPYRSSHPLHAQIMEQRRAAA